MRLRRAGARVCAFAALLSLTSLSTAQAHGPTAPPHQLYRIGDLPLEGGEAIRDFAISYVTHGTLNADKSNAILMVTAIGGNHHRIDFLIGPGKALDTDKYFIIATDAIGNGLTTSPSNSASQHGTAFPHFSIRDMVASQKLLLDHLGITHLVAVAGASMGGMQALQWGVSHPDLMDALVAITPMARTAPWSIAVNAATRKALMLDPAFKGGAYETQPELGWRLRADILQVLATRTPDALRGIAPHALDILPWMRSQEEAVLKTGFDANDWIAQTWAYDRHDVGQTPGYGGDHLKALAAIKARTLIITGGDLDLYNPVAEAREAGAYIPDASVVAIPSVQGHTAGSAAKAADVDFMNAAVRPFLESVATTRRR
ncbi:alpha/beta fold hydrolase [Methylobacterium sp. NEAU K]|uniref:alpha/beta fold hydrolase n=1 Tax=Methylobacterium sp. NEAU K TaxID=3064946 RepID=UPI0027333E24|nr:alpha/beta fold hydrolase [Methylobacterium sp. NEAU K]MDP4006451.1 alpha/beta fold hydrolase [Methylobacterium sp. NEAU K]